jgi:tetratricopeptide (TPR) repeat protein
MGRRSLIDPLLLTVIAVAATALAQGRNLKEEARRRDQLINDPARYAAMIEAYRTGDAANSVDLLADSEWDETRLKTQRSHLDTTPAQAIEIWQSAPMMHVDVALKLSPTLEDEVERAWLHLWMAEELIRLGIRERGDAIRDRAERMYVALARLLVDGVAPYSAERVLRTARRQLPGHASVLYESGRLAELLATDYALAGHIQLNSAAHGPVVLIDRVMQRRIGHLNEALDWLRGAAALDRENDLLQVHLGRVLALRGNDDEAAAILGRVQSGTKDGATSYLASTYIGGLRERQGRLDDAETAYRAAIVSFPLGHAAYIGLSEVLQRTGRGDQAREVLTGLVTERLGPAREPLWWYFFDPPGVAERRLDEVRKEARQ